MSELLYQKVPKNILMPNLFSLSERQARVIMEENGISQGHLSRTYSKAVEKDHIIRAGPASQLYDHARYLGRSTGEYGATTGRIYNARVVGAFTG